MCRCLAWVVLLGWVLAPASLPGETWRTLTPCRLSRHDSNDGDSFHVKHAGKEYIFRLLYVDAPEKKSMGLTERTTEQARYFKILKRDLYLLAGQASTFTAEQLSTPFQVQTQWEDAQGDSRLPRYYAVITTGKGQDLASLLIQHGLARIHGRPVRHPDGRSGDDVEKALARAEAKAREDRVGAWAFQRPKK